jgi:hypothetical protein
MSVFDTCHRNHDNLKYMSYVIKYSITQSGGGYGEKERETVAVCDRDTTMDIWLILPGICHITGHGKRPPHMTGHGKRPVMYLVYAHIYQVLS